jgi:hypothetical protein
MTWRHHTWHASRNHFATPQHWCGEIHSDPHMVMNANAQVSSMSQKLVCIFLVGHQRTPDTDMGYPRCVICYLRESFCCLSLVEYSQPQCS